MDGPNPFVVSQTADGPSPYLHSGSEEGHSLWARTHCFGGRPLDRRVWARREARAQRSGRMIEEFSDAENENEDEEEMVIPNAVWYFANVMVLAMENVVTLLVEEHRATEEPV
ncbi:hypothetical protein TanjilG_09142 [Lupinus angustifolius]|uniref:Uncharacterized protein n=1 Tax=Lupinus angustifolius TaxID=3871 RepID=A0A1J7J1D5_LUPAN|nr:hypothetical protein TanjilG_09142 [Lupinus angustifolius]